MSTVISRVSMYTMSRNESDEMGGMEIQVWRVGCLRIPVSFLLSFLMSEGPTWCLRHLLRLRRFRPIFDGRRRNNRAVKLPGNSLNPPVYYV
jgi:hypothetical protein